MSLQIGRVTPVFHPRAPRSSLILVSAVLVLFCQTTHGRVWDATFGNPGCLGFMPSYTLNEGEECDNAFDSPNGCTSCGINDGYACCTSINNVIGPCAYLTGFSTYCHVVTCGDNYIDTPIEQCEPPNVGTCSATCQIIVPVCGNGIKEGTEACDDGNAVSGDGCEPVSCSITVTPAGWTCNPINPSVSSSTSVCQRCGNGDKEGTEACDDGNAASGDGCSPTCSIETGWTCPGNVCASTCGDGLIVGSEVCDLASGNGADPLTNPCNAACTAFNTGWQCLDPANAATCSRCGDGVVSTDPTTPLEQCDLGDSLTYPSSSSGSELNNSTQLISACSSTCTRNLHWKCQTYDHARASTCKRCGNGIIDPTFEECDDNNNVSGDGCSAQCKKEYPYVLVNNKFSFASYDDSLGTVTSSMMKTFPIASTAIWGADVSRDRKWFVFVTDGALPNDQIRVFYPNGTRHVPDQPFNFTAVVVSGKSPTCTAKAVKFAHDSLHVYIGRSCRTNEVATSEVQLVTRYNIMSGGDPDATFNTPLYTLTSTSMSVVTIQVVDRGIHLTLDGSSLVAAIDRPGGLVKINAVTGVTTWFAGTPGVPTNVDVYGDIVIATFNTGSILSKFMISTASAFEGDNFYDLCIQQSIVFPSVISSIRFSPEGSALLIAGTGTPTSVGEQSILENALVVVSVDACEYYGHAAFVKNADGIGSNSNQITRAAWYPIQSGSSLGQYFFRSSGFGSTLRSRSISSPATALPYTTYNTTGTAIYALEPMFYRPAADECGDGFTDLISGETCDDGNTANGDGCSATCIIENGWTCSTLPTDTTIPETTCRPICGDALVVGTEPCDLGTGQNGAGSGCVSVGMVDSTGTTYMECTTEIGWRCSGLGCSVCGDGVARHGEFCDDGNMVDTDGCSNTCEIVSGWSCSFPHGNTHSECFFCGNGIREGNEGCDLGTVLNNEGTHGCSPACSVTPGYRCAGTCALDTSVFSLTSTESVSFYTRDSLASPLSGTTTLTLTGAMFTFVQSDITSTYVGTYDATHGLRIFNISSTSSSTGITETPWTTVSPASLGITPAPTSIDAIQFSHNGAVSGLATGKRSFSFTTHISSPGTSIVDTFEPSSGEAVIRGTPVLSPTGEMVALFMDGGAPPYPTTGPSTLNIYRRNIQHGTGVTILPSNGAGVDCGSLFPALASWSPDEQFLAVACGDDLKILDMKSDPVGEIIYHRATLADGGSATHVTWSPQSNRTLVTTTSGNVLVYDITDHDIITQPVTLNVCSGVAGCSVLSSPSFAADRTTFSVLVGSGQPVTSAYVQTVTSGVGALPMPTYSLSPAFPSVPGNDKSLALGFYTMAVCDDGIVNAPETCDLGAALNGAPGSGCSDTCSTVSGYQCTDGSASQAECTLTPVLICSDGIVSDDETCDDGNLRDGDGCNSLCQAEGLSVCPLTGGACTCGEDNDCDGDGTCSNGACVCAPGKFGPRCKTRCGAACVSAGGTCSASSLNADYCDCPVDTYPSTNTLFGPRCATICSATTCPGGTCDAATGDCIPSAQPSANECLVCHRYTIATHGFGAYTFQTLSDASAHGCTSITLNCEPEVSTAASSIVASGTVIRGRPHAPIVFTTPIHVTGTNAQFDNVYMIDSLSPSSSVPIFNVDVATRLVFSRSEGVPVTPPNHTPHYTNAQGNRASDVLCGAPFTREFIDSFFDIFVDVAYRTPGAARRLKTSPMLSVAGLYGPNVTPDQVRCIILYMHSRGLAPSFVGRKRPGGTLVRGQVHSPFTFSGQIVVGYTGNAIEMDLAGGLLTFSDNIFIDVTGSAGRFTGVDSMVVDNNLFVDTGGESGDALFIQGIAGTGTTFSVTNNEVTSYRDSLVTGSPAPLANAAAFHLKDFDTATSFTISGNKAQLVGPAPLKGFQHGMFLDNVPVLTATCGPASLAGKEDERCIALANPATQGTMTHITRDAVPVPPESEFCNDLCSPSLMVTPDPSSSTVTYDASSVVHASQLGSDPQAVHFSVDFSISHTHAFAIPVVEFVPVDDIRSPRERTNCASRLPGPAPTWDWAHVFDETVLGNTPRWTTVNVTSPTDPLVLAHPGVATYRAEADFTLADLLTCVDYTAAPVVSHTVATNTYNFQICSAFVGPNNVHDEAAGFIVVHRDCVPVSLTVESIGSVLVSITTALINFHAEVVRSEFLTTTDQLQLTLRTRIDSVAGALKNLRSATMVGTTGTLLGPVDWTIGTPSTNPCDYITIPGTCIQTWIVTSNNPSQALQELFLGIQSYEFTIYRDNAIAPGVNPVAFTVSLNIERGSAQDILARIGATATVHRTNEYPLSPQFDPVTSSFLYGERAYFHVCADLPAGHENEVALDVLSAVYCTPTFPQYIADYDPLNPDTTGCATFGAGIGTHHGEWYNMAANTAYTANSNIESVQQHLATDHTSCTMVSAKVNNWIGDRVETYLQFFLEMRSLLDPASPIIHPAGPTPLVPIHSTVHAGTSSTTATAPVSTASNPRSSALPGSKTVRMVMRVSLQGDFAVSIVPETVDSAKANSHETKASTNTNAATANAHGAFVDITSPMHSNGVSLRVLCANTTYIYSRVEDKHYDAKYECIDPSKYTEIPSDSYSWWQTREDADAHRHRPLTRNDDSNDDDDDQSSYAWVGWLFGVIVIIIAILAVAMFSYYSGRKSSRYMMVDRQPPIPRV